MRRTDPLSRYRTGLLGLGAVVSLSFSTVHVPAQAGAASASPVKLPSFDIVSIRANKSGSGSMRISTRDSNFTATNITLKNLVLNAYNLKEAQLVGLPGWAESARFDIEAKILDPDLNVLNNLDQEQRGSMLRAMLADRFQFKSHTETAMLPVYELVVAKGGPKLKLSAGKDNSMSFRNTEITATGMLLSSLAFSLSSHLQRIVLDKTGLTGNYDIALKWSSDDAPPLETAPPPLFTAIQEQLGLKLIASKAPIGTLVVDHVEMPSEN